MSINLTLQIKMQKVATILKDFLKKSWTPYLLIGLVIFTIYAPTLFYDIVYLDDNVLVKSSYTFNKDLSNIPRAFNEDIFRVENNMGSFYRPMLRVSFIFDAQLKESMLIFVSHFTNVVLHIISICLLFILFTKLNIKKQRALMVSLILGVHPLTTQVATWIAGRNDSILAIFILSSFIYFINYLNSKKISHYFLHLLFFVLALFSKETAIVFPVVCFSYFVIFIPRKKVMENYKVLIRMVLVWGWLILIYFIIRHVVINTFIVNSLSQTLQSIYQNLPAVIPAIGKVVLPFNLSVFPVLNDMNMTYGVISILLLLTWYLFSKEKNNKMIVFGICWFFLFVFLTLIKPTGVIADFTESRIYIPMFGLSFILFGLGKIEFVNKILKKNKLIKFFSEKAIFASTVVLIIIFSFMTFQRNNDYKSGLNFWRSAVATSPSHAFNHANLGIMYYLNNDASKAKYELTKALEIHPKEKYVHNFLGLIYADEGKLDEAEEELKKEITLSPYYGGTYLNLGSLYFREGDVNTAKEYWNKTLKTSPNNFEEFYAMLTLYYNKEDKARADTFIQAMKNE